MNPLDWSAGPFLAFYIALMVLCGIGIAVHRFALRGRAVPMAGRDPDMLELAWLTRGAGHVADTAIVALLAADAAVFEPGRLFRRARLRIDAARARLPRGLEPFRHLVVGETTRARFAQAAAPAVAAIGEGLAERGLAPSPADIARHRVVVFLLTALPLVWGGLKIDIGLSRNRPVGFLIVLVVIAAIVGLRALLVAPRLTREGRDALRAAKLRHARAARAPLGEEIALAFALTGAAVLAGTPYAAFGAHVGNSGGSGGGADGGGDGGGGGCGGCS